MKHRIANRNLPQLLLTARESLMSHFRPILNHFGVTEQQWRILRVLDQHGQLAPWELCEMCQILSPSMAGMLARMEETGLVRKTPNPEDPRRMIVRLAAKGDRLLMEMAPLIDEQYQYIEQAYGKRMLDDMFELLQGFMGAGTTTVRKIDLPKNPAAARKTRKA
ncbi:homoprotocatechuate degradation operon regulator HpaR [Herbaspirillum sp. HC18]|nr:homoprotocatechuate degradation operon regulator HpaR [Herbaspirillum sp. HC18]